MLILTLSSHNQEDGSLNDLVGLFTDIAAIKEFISSNYDDSYAKFKEIKKPEIKAGLEESQISIKGLDNGWGGRYFSIWEPIAK